MSAFYYTAVALIAAACFGLWSWIGLHLLRAVLKLIALREGFTDALQVFWETFRP